MFKTIRNLENSPKLSLISFKDLEITSSYVWNSTKYSRYIVNILFVIGSLQILNDMNMQNKTCHITM